MEMTVNKPELLAPAGDYLSITTAINAGADAVYAGTDRFSARAYAQNLSEEEYIRALDIAHLNGVKIYLTLNTLVSDEELKDVFKVIKPLYEHGLDGIIVQDLGVSRLVKEYFPGLELHASTQMAVMNASGASFLKKYGFTRIVPARELTLKEIIHIKQEVDTQLECFIHGAMCYSYSGMCLMSSMIGGRSGNRGRCAGTCRLPFSVETGEGLNKDMAYPLSMKDLCTLDLIPDLIDAGVDSFKIEGRMKSPEYVAHVTSLYRKYIDLYMTEGLSGYKVDTSDKEKLNGLYIRTDVSQGYYEGIKGAELITGDNPGYNGADEKEKSNIRSRYVGECAKIPVSMHVYAHTGESIRLDINPFFDEKYSNADRETCDIGISVTGGIVSRAEKSPVTEESLVKQLSKTGNTPFEVKRFTADADDDIFVRIGDLNELRRAATAGITERIISSKGLICHRDLPRERETYTTSCHENCFTDKKIHENVSRHRMEVSVMTLDQLYCAVKHIDRIDSIFIDYSLFLNGPDPRVIKALAESSTEVNLMMPAVFRSCIVKGSGKFEDAPSLYGAIDSVISSHGFIRGIMVNSIDELAYINEAYPDKKITAGPHIYEFNQSSTRFLRETSNISEITVSYELNLSDIHRLTENAVSAPECDPDMAVNIYGYIPMMVSAGCIKKTMGKCDGIVSVTYLTDRKNKRFPVLNDCRICSNIIFNEVPLCLIGMIEKLNRIDGIAYRVNLTVEDEETADTVLCAFLEHDAASVTALKKADTTTGHLKRGVLQV